jgi:hypothetical protein
VSASEFVQRLQRTTLVALAAMAATAFVIKPTQPRLALGVLGGGALIGLSYWGLCALADVVAKPRDFAEKRRSFRIFALVKFFTRHAILALAAYGMMARLELHPIGLLIGVSAPGVAAAVEAWRARRRP